MIDWRVYWNSREVLPRWLDVFIVARIVGHILWIILGVWQLTERGLEFVWATPVAIHLTIPGLAYTINRCGSTLPPWFRYWLATWGVVNFLVSVVSVATAGVQGG